MDEDIEVVPFTEALTEGYLDLAEKDDSADPLYGGQSSREERTARLNRQTSSGITRAHLVALKGDFLVGSAKANLPPKCGEAMEAPTLSMMVHEKHRREGIGTCLLNRPRLHCRADRHCVEEGNQVRAPITSGLPDNEAVLNPSDIPWDRSGTNELLIHRMDEVFWEKRLN